MAQFKVRFDFVMVWYVQCTVYHGTVYGPFRVLNRGVLVLSCYLCALISLCAL